MHSILTRGAGQGQQAASGTQVILDVQGLDALKTALPTVQSLQPGDRGQIILTGPGLGIAADLSGAEVAWRNIFGRAGLGVQDIHGEGLQTAIVDWYVPAERTLLASPEDANMASPVAAVVLIGAIVAVVLFLGWLVLGRIQVLLFGEGGKGGLLGSPIGWVLLVGAVLLMAGGIGKVVRGEQEAG